jgi:hypothetical protein
MVYDTNGIAFDFSEISFISEDTPPAYACDPPALSFVPCNS